MNERYLTENLIRQFAAYLIQEEKSKVTIEKYLRDTRAFAVFADGQAVNKEVTISYKHHLQERGYQADIQELRERLDEIWQLQRRILLNQR